MIVKIVKTGKKQEFNDSYAARLIEQGKAVPCAQPKEPEPFMNEPEPAANEPEPEKKERAKAGKNRKGD